MASVKILPVLLVSIVVSLTTVQTAKYITSINGAPINDQSGSISVGPNGPLLAADSQLFEELAAFVRESIPVRSVHGKGAGAMGYFEVTNDITHLCDAALFSKVGKKTPITSRFSLGAGKKGTPDTTQDLRGFAVKFYTEEGNLDIIQSSIPVLFTREPKTTVGYNHATINYPTTGVKNMTALWDMYSLRPEATFFNLYFFSKFGLPDGYRHMDVFSVNTFILVNGTGSSVYARFVTKTNQGVKFLNVTAARALAGSEPEYATYDLYDAIAAGDYPSWTLNVQYMTPEEYKEAGFNPSDPTKVWSEDKYPPIEIGKIVLNKNPTNNFEQVEQIAMSPGNLVPGLQASPHDKILQARILAYPDSQRYRIGANFHKLPMNCPFEANYYLRDGPMAFDNREDKVSYYPNSFDGLEINPRAILLTPRFPVEGIVGRYDNGDEDNYEQAAEFYKTKLNIVEQKTLALIISATLAKVPEVIIRRLLSNYANVSDQLVKDISTNLGLTL